MSDYVGDYVGDHLRAIRREAQDLRDLAKAAEPAGVMRLLAQIADAYEAACQIIESLQRCEQCGVVHIAYWRGYREGYEHAMQDSSSQPPPQ